MGHLDQLAKQTFAEETEAITGGAVVWEAGPEIGLTEVRVDGLLLVRDPARLATLAPPWPEAAEHEEILTELKMQGDHLDDIALERTLLRRQARQVQRMEVGLGAERERGTGATEARWRGQEPLWEVAPHLPGVLRDVRTVRRVAPGCYRIEPSSFSFLWIAANELPLREELIPFLVARSGRPFVEFLRWVMVRRPAAWIMRMLEIVPMPMSAQEEFDRYLAPLPHDDPEFRERGMNLARIILRIFPEAGEELSKKGLEQGLEQGLEHFAHLFERRLGRELSAEEQQTLRDRFKSLGGGRLVDVSVDLSPEVLAAWLSDPAAT
jgi:hypothetical protein